MDLHNKKILQKNFEKKIFIILPNIATYLLKNYNFAIDNIIYRIIELLK